MQITVVTVSGFFCPEIQFRLRNCYNTVLGNDGICRIMPELRGRGARALCDLMRLFIVLEARKAKNSLNSIEWCAN